MRRNVFVISLLAAALAGCSTGWLPWVTTEKVTTGPYTPAGATGYACDGGKRMLLRFESDRKSAWVIYPDHQLRLDRVTSTSGEEFSRAGTTLRIAEGEATLTEGVAVQFSKCTPEAAK